jgi:hypothetical protein
MTLPGRSFPMRPFRITGCRTSAVIELEYVRVFDRFLTEVNALDRRDVACVTPKDEVYSVKGAFERRIALSFGVWIASSGFYWSSWLHSHLSRQKNRACWRWWLFRTAAYPRVAVCVPKH